MNGIEVTIDISTCKNNLESFIKEFKELTNKYGIIAGTFDIEDEKTGVIKTCMGVQVDDFINVNDFKFTYK